MKRLSSFTVIELIIALFISSVTIAICYYVFFLMNSRFNAFYARSQQVSEYQLFCKAIRRDMGNAVAIQRPADKMLSLRFDNEQGIDYFFNDSSIIRQQQLNADTFRLINAVRSFMQVNDSIPLISLVKIEVTMNKELFAVTVPKDYTPQELINHYPRAND